MNIGLYTIFLGMRARQNTLEVQANNIANASTTGFKADRLSYSTIEAQKKGDGARQEFVAAAMTSSANDFTAGTVQQTGRTLDVAIEGDAFLQIQTARGLRFTRAGNLNLDANGQLVTSNGEMVVGQKGPITVPKKGQIAIGPDGAVSSDGKLIDSLKLVRFENPTAALTKEGDTMFMMTGAEQPQDNISSKVVQGALESSNINSITEMVAMINNNREFENLQKGLSLLGEAGRKIAGEIGRL